jgi:hypothetical protein
VRLIHYLALIAVLVFAVQMIMASAATAAGLRPGASFLAWFKPALAQDEHLTPEGRRAQRRYWAAVAKLVVAGIVFVLTD